MCFPFTTEGVSLGEWPRSRYVRIHIISIFAFTTFYFHGVKIKRTRLFSLFIRNVAVCLNSLGFFASPRFFLYATRLLYVLFHPYLKSRLYISKFQCDLPVFLDCFVYKASREYAGMIDAYVLSLTMTSHDWVFAIFIKSKVAIRIFQFVSVLFFIATHIAR